MTTSNKLRDVARDAESDTHSAIWDYPEVLREAAEKIDYLTDLLNKIEILTATGEGLAPEECMHIHLMANVRTE